MDDGLKTAIRVLDDGRFGLSVPCNIDGHMVKIDGKPVQVIDKITWPEPPPTPLCGPAVTREDILAGKADDFIEGVFCENMTIDGMPECRESLADFFYPKAAE